ncbi:MAG: hypothetical protein K1Y36_24095 [Blastocatellia bacterium]|nr:hypothetical protein [Blastocatellia bacterium]
MPAHIGLGLGRALPAGSNETEVLQHLTAFAEYEFISAFYEVVEGKLYQIARADNQTKVTLVHPDQPLPDWNPLGWREDYTYPQWYEAMLAAWNSQPGGDLTYNEWSEIEMGIFVPFYEERSRWVKVPPFSDSVGVAGTETGISLGHELDLPDYYFKTFDIAGEFIYLVRISG